MVVLAAFPLSLRPSTYVRSPSSTSSGVSVGLPSFHVFNFYDPG